MGSRLRWFVTSNVVLVGLLLAIVLFWHAVEAPQRVAESGEKTPVNQTGAALVETVAAQVEVVEVAVAPVGVVSTPVVVPPVAEVPPTPSNQLVVRVPILMYHRIDWLPANPDALRRSLSITPSEFDSQVRFLKERGFTAVTLADVYEALQGKRKLPPKPVVLTFDDGYVDNYANAFPVLKRYGFSGTFFVLTDVAGTGEYMSWEQLKEMHAAGMKIESHGRTHLDLAKLSSAGMSSQIKGARDAIEARLGATPRFYAYPSGSYNRDVIETVKTNGYLAAVTTVYGTDHTLQKAYELKRVRVDGRESFAAFARKVGETP